MQYRAGITQLGPLGPSRPVSAGRFVVTRHSAGPSLKGTAEGRAIGPGLNLPNPDSCSPAGPCCRAECRCCMDKPTRFARLQALPEVERAILKTISDLENGGRGSRISGRNIHRPTEEEQDE